MHTNTHTLSTYEPDNGDLWPQINKNLKTPDVAAAHKKSHTSDSRRSLGAVQTRLQTTHKIDISKVVQPHTKKR